VGKPELGVEEQGAEGEEREEGLRLALLRVIQELCVLLLWR
jgi:hypothetical protein